MEKLNLQAEKRDLVKRSQGFRLEGMIPAELYGHNIPNEHLFVRVNEFEKVLRQAGESTVIDLVIEGAQSRPVLIHDVHRHPVKLSPLHIDFFQVSLTEKLRAHVELNFFGESSAIKALGGTLVKVINEVEVECLANDLPHRIEVNISSLNTFDDAILLKDIILPKGVIIVSDLDEVVAKVQAPRDLDAELTSSVEEDVTKVEGVVKPEAVKAD